MSDTTPDEGEAPFIRALRAKAEEYDQLAASNLELRTSNALLKAGLGNLSDLQQKALLSAHEGEPTAESLSATAEAIGMSVRTAPPTPPEEQAALGRMSAATGGAEPVGAYKKTVNDEMMQAKSREELLGILGREGVLASD